MKILEGIFAMIEMGCLMLLFSDILSVKEDEPNSNE